jgi:hypothetical protein
MKIIKTKPCGCPGDHRPDPSQNDPRCICNKPLLLYIPAGQHIHCPIHPQSIIRGSEITL